MATVTDLQRAHRNNERRERNTVGGEYIFSENGELAIGDEAVLASLPKNVILHGITVVGLDLGTSTVPTVTINGVAYTKSGSNIDGGVAELVVAAPILLKDAQQVIFKASAIVGAGRILVLPRFTEFDLTTGNRVLAV